LQICRVEPLASRLVLSAAILPIDLRARLEEVRMGSVEIGALSRRNACGEQSVIVKWRGGSQHMDPVELKVESIIRIPIDSHGDILLTAADDARIGDISSRGVIGCDQRRIGKHVI
jgi:hypothetical protein